MTNSPLFLYEQYEPSKIFMKIYPRNPLYINLSNEIVSEFQSNYIEWCSRKSIVENILKIKLENKISGFHPLIDQINVVPDKIMFEEINKTLENESKFKAFYEIPGSFYYYDGLTSIEGEKLILSVVFEGYIQEVGKIYDVDVKLNLGSQR